MIASLMISILLPAAVAVQAHGSAITSETKTETIQELCKEMRSVYAYADTGRKAAEAIETHFSNHDYDSLSDGEEFAKRLTSDLHDVCHDAHLHVEFSEGEISGKAGEEKLDAAQAKAMQERLRYVNAAFDKVERMDGNIGLLAFRNFLDPAAAKRPVKAAMEFLADTDALIIDLRHNGGGDPETVKLICSYFFPGRVHLNDLVQRNGDRIEFWTDPKVSGPKYLDRDVYILTSKRTASGAEEFSYDLKNLKRATVIGESTWGGANPGGFYRLSSHFQAFIPDMHAENPITRDNWEGKGVAPDIAVNPEEGLKTAYRMALQKEIARATDPERKAMLQKILQSQDVSKPGNPLP